MYSLVFFERYVREALKSVNDGDQNICGAEVLQFIRHTQPELDAFRGLDPKPSSFGTLGRRRQHIHSLVADQPLVGSTWSRLTKCQHPVAAVACLKIARSPISVRMHPQSSFTWHS